MENKLFKRIIPVGVGVLILDENNNILLGKRIIEDGFDLWSTPGGFLEPNESIFECAKRETLEETGINLKEIEYIGISHVIREKDIHFDVGCISYIDNIEINDKKIFDQEVQKWMWVSLDDLENYKLWEPCKAIIELYKSNKPLVEYYEK